METVTIVAQTVGVSTVLQRGIGEIVQFVNHVLEEERVKNIKLKLLQK
jgi:hypothetical protein